MEFLLQDSVDLLKSYRDDPISETERHMKVMDALTKVEVYLRQLSFEKVLTEKLYENFK
jgi:hypothetical protein